MMRYNPFRSRPQVVITETHLRTKLGVLRECIHSAKASRWSLHAIEKFLEEATKADDDHMMKVVESRFKVIRPEPPQPRHK